MTIMYSCGGAHGLTTLYLVVAVDDDGICQLETSVCKQTVSEQGRETYSNPSLALHEDGVWKK
jgi:hypothetical protein